MKEWRTPRAYVLVSEYPFNTKDSIDIYERILIVDRTHCEFVSAGCAHIFSSQGKAGY
jgi:hypothetical protein